MTCPDVLLVCGLIPKVRGFEGICEWKGGGGADKGLQSIEFADPLDTQLWGFWAV